MLDASDLSGGSFDANAMGSVLPGLDASGLPSVTAYGLTNSLQSNPRPLSVSSLPTLDSPVSSFSTGVFTVGETGEVSFDYLVDGGKYQGELAIFSLQGIERYGIGSKLFVQEAALRASTNSDLGHIVISDRTEGARFDGSPSERNFNAGQYQGVKKFSMRTGEQFGIMLVSNGTVQDVLRNPDNAKNRPMFSMPEVNLDSTVQMAQVVNVVADGNSFAFEDLWLNQNSDRDYNDMVFQIQGAKAQVAPLKDLINPDRDWRSSQQGQQLEEYAAKSLEEYEQSIVDPQDLAGNTIDKARKVSVSSRGKLYRGWVGTIDTNDFYSFSLGTRNEFKLSLDGLTSDANVELLDINGNVIQSSKNVGTATESINTTLESGAYRIRVNSSGNIGTAFNLNVSVTPLIQVAGVTITTTGSEETGEIATAESLPLIEVINSNNPGDNSFSSDPRFTGIDGQLNNGTRLSTVIIDTGINLQHPFFGNRIANSFDFADDDPDATDDSGDRGHGTNVTSIAAGSGTYNTSSKDTVTYRGVAPNANIIHLKVFEQNLDTFSFGDVEQALQWVVENAERFNIMSVNMSLGDGSNYNTLQSRDFNEKIAEQTRKKGISDELEALARKNVIVVSASGNNFFSFGSAQGVTYPSADPNSLSIGAVYDANVGSQSYVSGAIANTTNVDRITPFSQRHETLTTVFGPGAIITGAGMENNDLNTSNTFNDNFLSRMSGTSQAAPHVAGMVVLAQELALQELGRILTPAEFRQLLRDTSDPIFDGDENNNGQVDIGDEDDNVINTQRTYRRVNMLALANAILDLKPPSDRQIDLTAKSFDVVGEKFNTGDNFSVAFDIENLGSDKSYPFDVNFYLSSDATISEQDTLLGNFRINNLNRNSNTGIITQNLTLPSPDNPAWNSFGSGNAYIGMIIDGLNEVGETNEGNNRNRGVSIDKDTIQINQRGKLKVTFNRIQGDFDDFPFGSSDFYGEVYFPGDTSPRKTPQIDNNDDIYPNWQLDSNVSGVKTLITISALDNDPVVQDALIILLNLIYNLFSGEITFIDEINEYVIGKGGNQIYVPLNDDDGRGGIWFTVDFEPQA
ncbi:hypothetical protein WA1_04805 [Scytonema hofmannii PCC 7110]|uniref:Peptidase S8/S53 domain-containing protein n=1 Tax=Scytonema hofmannii PCC 7110 TaxID=128403 RepID=A0A139WZN6_9CYAN|nr:S8 family serine peptidase [Scytonema hofmannii]KYC37832.1 hypothetical protein WA1_04805 [Scytonema hofmannii PCC 7110]